MGRHKVGVSSLATGYRNGPRWSDPYHCEWAVVVGDRIRRLRNERRLTLVDMSRLIEKPNEGGYSPGYFSRLERGWATAPLYVYIVIADTFGVPPGRLLGPDDAQRPVTEAEMTLVRLLRRLRVSPDEAIALALDRGRVPASAPETPARDPETPARDPEGPAREPEAPASGRELPARDPEGPWWEGTAAEEGEPPAP